MTMDELVKLVDQVKSIKKDIGVVKEALKFNGKLCVKWVDSGMIIEYILGSSLLLPLVEKELNSALLIAKCKIEPLLKESN